MTKPEFRLVETLDMIGDHLAALDLMFIDRTAQMAVTPRHMGGIISIIDRAADELKDAHATLDELRQEVRALRPSGPSAPPLADILPAQIVEGILRACEEAGQAPEPAWLWREAAVIHDILLTECEAAEERPIVLTALLRKLGRELRGGIRAEKWPEASRPASAPKLTEEVPPAAAGDRGADAGKRSNG